MAVELDQISPVINDKVVPIWIMGTQGKERFLKDQYTSPWMMEFPVQFGDITITGIGIKMPALKSVSDEDREHLYSLEVRQEISKALFKWIGTNLPKHSLPYRYWEEAQMFRCFLPVATGGLVSYRPPTLRDVQDYLEFPYNPLPYAGKMYNAVKIAASADIETIRAFFDSLPKSLEYAGQSPLAQNMIFEPCEGYEGYHWYDLMSSIVEVGIYAVDDTDGFEREISALANSHRQRTLYCEDLKVRFTTRSQEGIYHTYERPCDFAFYHPGVPAELSEVNVFVRGDQLTDDENGILKMKMVDELISLYYSENSDSDLSDIDYFVGAAHRYIDRLNWY